jgi:methylated-DNA-[protein]-cysteine S-methyltransferase
MDYTFRYTSPLGDITIAGNDFALTGLWFDGQKYFADNLNPEHKERFTPIFEQTMAWLDIYFSGKAPTFTPPLSIRATPFRRSVLEILLTIPFGKTMTYGEIARIAARQMGVEKMSAQAVGNAVGHNPISIIVPCHRVVGVNGDLTGYAGGIERKEKLLELERAGTERLSSRP